MVYTRPNRWGEAEKSKCSRREATSPRWRLVTPATSDKSAVWKLNGPKRQRGPKKKLNTTKVREPRRVLQDRLGFSCPARMRAREVLEELNKECKGTQTDHSGPIREKIQPENETGQPDAPMEEEMMKWSIRRLKGYLSQADLHAYGLRITLVQRLHQFFIQNPEKMRQMMNENNPKGCNPKAGPAPAEESTEGQTGQKPNKPWQDEGKKDRNIETTTKAAEGLRQRKERQQYWEDKLLQRMEYLMNKDDTEAWITDEYWLWLPNKVREARRATREYEQRFVGMDDPEVAGRKPEILECGRCGTVFLEGEDLLDTLETHRKSQCAVSKHFADP